MGRYLVAIAITFNFSFIITSRVSAQVPFRASTEIADKLIEEAEKHLGKPYHWGGKGPKSFDCAGFTRFVYGKFGVELPPSAASQYRVGKVLKNNEIRRGDLVFYAGRRGGKSIGHVGLVTLVTDDGFLFIHAATSSGVTVSSSHEAYYSRRYIGACRVIDKIPQCTVDTKDTVSSVPVHRQIIFGEK